MGEEGEGQQQELTAEQRARYDSMIAAGESHNMAELLATRSFPGLGGTEAAFNRGRCNGNQFEKCPWLGDHYRGIARSAGVSTAGKYYVHGLGRFPGDPRAWCSDTSDALAVARERNLNLDGIVNHRGHAVDPTPDVPLAEDLWLEATDQYRDEHPGCRYEDAREAAFRKRARRGSVMPAIPPDPHPELFE